MCDLLKFKNNFERILESHRILIEAGERIDKLREQGYLKLSEEEENVLELYRVREHQSIEHKGHLDSVMRAIKKLSDDDVTATKTSEQADTELKN